jgi:uncharacterized protein YkwD
MKNLALLKYLFFLNVFITIGLVSAGQELSNEESELYDLVMAYRRSKGLTPIPLSRSLTFVAQAHVKDLEDNYQRNGKCNYHSWSDRGTWKAVCYTDNHAQAKLMWSKPQELTTYKGYGFEIAFAESEAYLANAWNSLNSWKSSRAHNAVILNREKWKKKWNAIGIGIFGSYAVIWFGNEPDK